MRYEDWDVLLFPAGRYSNTPFKEFRVSCQAIPDVELSHCHGAVPLPIVTCFVPSIKAGEPFQVSVHSWSDPDISSFTKVYSKHFEAVQFEARVFIDGRLVASSVFHRKNVDWPHVIKTTFDLSKPGEPALLKFPAFQKSLQFENTCNAWNNIGRIKVVISEGFPRDSPAAPLERVKNLVAFSFQYAPLEVLEAHAIAWPNTTMWRAVPTLSYPTMSTTGFPAGEGQVSHGHSPRRQTALENSHVFHGCQDEHQFQGLGGRRTIDPVTGTGTGGFSLGLGFPPGPPNVPCIPSSSGMATDGVNDMAYYDWMNHLSAPFVNDFTGKPLWPAPIGFSQPGLSYSNNDMIRTAAFAAPDTSGQDLDGEPMHISGPSLEDDPELVPVTNAHTKVPTNTPTATTDTSNTSLSALFQLNTNTNNSFLNPNFAHSLTHSLLNQPLPVQPQNIPLPASEIKSRKERDSRFLTIYGSNPASAVSTPQGPAAIAHPDIRKFSQPLFSAASGNVFRNNNATTTASTSPCSAAFTSTTVSRHPSNNLAAVDGASSSNFTSGGTPLPIRNRSFSAGGPGSGRKRSRNFTPASSKAIDDEDQPLRPSPHLRSTLGMASADSDSD